MCCLPHTRYALPLWLGPQPKLKAYVCKKCWYITGRCATMYFHVKDYHPESNIDDSGGLARHVKVLGAHTPEAWLLVAWDLSRLWNTND